MATIIQHSNFRQDARFRKPLYTKDGKPIFGVKATPGDNTPKVLCGAGIAEGSTNAIRYDYYGPQFAIKEGFLTIFNDETTVQDESVCRIYYYSRHTDAELDYSSVDKCKEWLNAKVADFRSRINTVVEKGLADAWNNGQAVLYQTPTSTIYDGEGPFKYFEQSSAAYFFANFYRNERETISLSSPGSYQPWVDMSSVREQRGIVLSFPTCETGARLILPLKVNPQVKVWRNDENDNDFYPEIQFTPSVDLLAIPLDGAWTNEIDETRRLIPSEATITRVQASSSENPTPWAYVDAAIEIVVPASRAVFICADLSHALEQAWNTIANYEGVKTDKYAFLRDRTAQAFVYLFVDWPYSRDTTFARPVAP